MEHLKCASFRYTPVLPINFRVIRKGLLGTNTLAYYKKSKVMDVKSFITLGSGHKALEPFLLSEQSELEYTSGLAS